MTQVNTPYPSTSYLTAYLKAKGFEVEQRDWSLLLFLKLFSAQGLERIFQALPAKSDSNSVIFFKEAFDDYKKTIDPIIHFLQGNNNTLALRISTRMFVPEGPRFLPLLDHQNLLSGFGELGTQDRAKYIASLYLDDIADVIKAAIDPNFEMSRYGEKLASSEISFQPLFDKIEGGLSHAPKSSSHAPTKSADQKNKATLVDIMLNEIVEDELKSNPFDVVGLTVPFPGNMIGALQIAKFAKKINPKIKIVMGGGFVNTELRELSDPRIFKYIDFLTYDDGERPLELLFNHLADKNPLRNAPLLRTKFLSESGDVVYQSNSSLQDVPFKLLPTPTQEGLPLSKYVSMLELPNPMHRMWSDFRWNKLILAHGCYWRKCTFCDVNLDYINRFEPARVDDVVDHMVQLAKESGSTGFHFVDEAAPPALLKALSIKLIERKLSFTWWGNLRFDKQFTPELAQLMADAGCVAVTGGLEVASPRLLSLINKGVTLEQVARVTKAFSDVGIYVHAYLMYGFPSQTVQETVDSLEYVRQLFLNKCIHSAFWHRFICTVHSPVGKNPDKFGVVLQPRDKPKHGVFAINEIPFKDSVETDHFALGAGLRKALYNYLHGVGLKEDVNVWFTDAGDVSVPKTKVAKKFITSALKNSALCFAAVGLFYSTLLNASELTLKAAVEDGLQNSPVVQKSESAHRESIWRVRESLTTFLPTLNASVNYLTQYRYVLTDINLGTPQSVPQVLPTSQLAITAQLPLFDGGASINKYRANRSLEISAENDFLWTQFKVSREILLQYFKVIAASTLKQVAEQNVKALSDHLRDVKLFKKAGVVTNFDVLKVEVQVSEAHSELLTRSDDIVLQRNRLSELLGLENDERAVNEKLPVLKEEMLQGRNFNQPTLRKDLFSLVSKTEALKFSSQSAGRYWVPRLNLFGQYLYYNNRSDHFSAQEDYRDAYQVGLQLTWNIFDGMSSIARSHEAVEQYYQAEKSLRLTQIKSKQEIDLWKRKFIYNCSIYQARVSDVEKSEESERLASQGRKAGTRTNTDLLDAESELYRARAGLVNAQIGSIEALINLELATGSEIHNFF